MAIATLIAAGRLDERLLARALDCVSGAAFDRWIDEGDAADIRLPGDGKLARLRLEAIEGLDVAIHTEPRMPPRLFVADMDSTMIGQECIDELADYAGFKERVAAITERAMQGELDFPSALAERVALLAGLDLTVLSQCRQSRIRPNPGAATLVATLRARGVMTVLVSGGFTDFVAPIANELSFDAHHANCLGAKNGKLSGVTEGEIVDGAAKRRIAEHILADKGWSTANLVAIGDGANDVPMVELAGFGVGYRPKPALAAIADGVIRHHDLTALLWMLGIPRRDWVI